MSHGSSSPVPGDRSSPSPEPDSENYIHGSHNPDPVLKEENAAVPPPTTRSNRPSRACTIRAASRLYSSPPAIERKPKKEQRREESPPEQCSKIVTPLVEPPTESQLPRWNLRSMWELASVLNFLRVSCKAVIFVIGLRFYICLCFESLRFCGVPCCSYLGLCWISHMNFLLKSSRLLFLTPMILCFIFTCLCWRLVFFLF